MEPRVGSNLILIAFSLGTQPLSSRLVPFSLSVHTHFYPFNSTNVKSKVNMHSQSILALALATFASTSLAGRSHIAARNELSQREPEPIPEDIRAAIVMAGKDFNQLTARQVEDAASLLARLPAGHGAEKRVDTAASLLALLPAGHGAEKREPVDTAASLLALLPAGHGVEKREPVDTVASLLALLPAGHGAEKVHLQNSIQHQLNLN